MYYSRLLEDKIKRAAQYFKIVLLTGARQVGKSTLLKHVFPDYPHIVFDPIIDLWQARQDPELFIKNTKTPVIFDEIQYCTEILPVLKRVIDETDEKGQYLLTGSQHFNMLKEVAESLAGRVSIIEFPGLTPYEYHEVHDNWLTILFKSPKQIHEYFQGVLPLDHSLYEWILRGNLPEAIQLPFDLVSQYYASYLKTYLDRDIRSLENIRDLSSFERFLALISALTAQEIHYTQLGRELGIVPATAHRWLQTIIQGYQWFELMPFYKNTIKRLSKKPKGHISNTGLACHLLGIGSAEALSRHPMLGHLFESFCISMIQALSQALDYPAKNYYFRTHNGAEVDLILERDGLVYPIEIKCKSQVSRSDVSGIQAFMDTYPNETIPLALILHAGTECYYVTDKILALPWHAVLRKNPS